MINMFIAGNWKMHTLQADSAALATEIVKTAAQYPDVKIMIAPPFTAIPAVAPIVKNSSVLLGAQNVAFAPSGAYTGEISVDMLHDLGVRVCIIGHSERRIHFAETNERIREKIILAASAGMEVILCVGETLKERTEQRETEVVGTQLHVLHGLEKDVFQKLTIAYEPVWAINTGKAATSEDAQSMHLFIRGRILGYHTEADKVCIQYGGSVNPDNAAGLLGMPDVNGALVGGASLDASRFMSIIAQAQKGL